jgi:hypothetical protein
MPPDDLSRGSVRSAAALNEEIRALWTGPGAHPAVRLTDAQRAEYQRLLAALRQIERGGVTTAA